MRAPGYVQIKIYSSVKPELVPIVAEEAHKRGMHVSAHVPSGMIAEQFIPDGADEIQHMNFVLLNFWPQVKARLARQHASLSLANARLRSI